MCSRNVAEAESKNSPKHSSRDLNVKPSADEADAVRFDQDRYKPNYLLNSFFGSLSTSQQGQVEVERVCVSKW